MSPSPSQPKPGRYWHPFAFALQPVISQYAYNVQIVAFFDILRAALVLFFGVLVLRWGIRQAVRDQGKAAFLTSLFLIALFFWGHVVHLVIPPENFYYKTRYFLGYTGVFAVLAVGGCALKSSGGLHRFLSIVGALLALFPLLTWAAHMGTGARRIGVGAASSAPPHWEVGAVAGTERPDVLVLMLDGYSRADVLREDYDYDNSPFLEDLHARGFYVATNSLANYNKTLWSLGSALNGDYLEHLLPAELAASRNLRPLVHLFHHNRVFAWFRHQGYRLYAFETGFELADMRNSVDHFLAPRKWGNEFEALLLQLTPLPAIHQRLSGKNYFFESHRERIHFVFTQLQKMAPTRDATPRFIWAHVNMPHDPLVFGAAGEARQYQDRFVWGDAPPPQFTWAEYAFHASEQITYLNHLVLETIDAYQAAGAAQPIIMVFSDHGAHNLPHHRCEEHFRNLMAFSLPPSLSWSAPRPFSLVDLFPIVINALLQDDGAIPLVTETRCYQVDWTTPYAPIPCLTATAQKDEL